LYVRKVLTALKIDGIAGISGFDDPAKLKIGYGDNSGLEGAQILSYVRP